MKMLIHFICWVESRTHFSSWKNVVFPLWRISLNCVNNDQLRMGWQKLQSLKEWTQIFASSYSFQSHCSCYEVDVEIIFSLCKCPRLNATLTKLVENLFFEHYCLLSYKSITTPYFLHLWSLLRICFDKTNKKSASQRF